ncbi:type II secretion system protein [Paraferrimonas sedimenticola]|uniref:MSHA pilin protein MshA n=1 Tax=Paraferrimonas sedimenticola TaxID=375674 RepID=A0AA37RXA2_9GAMM|nr:prepilin-type N-terminal cleavage/methylation domain-containing protein [Paraferrimonas sedimenticola]GLP97385.1 MSHA pilin protein MshA [Paraferrimonas sedimenticola]
MKQQSGFTLVELVVVIIILGVLAVTAAPKFIDLKGDARKSTLQGVKAATQGANALVFSKAAIAGKEREASSSISINSDSIAIQYGYVAPSCTALTTALEIDMSTDTNGTSDWVCDLISNQSVAGVGPIISIYQRGSIVDLTTTDDQSCHLQYHGASANDRPQIELKMGKC